MKKVLFILTLIPLSLLAQVIKIDGDNHLVTEKSFPLFLNEGTQIEIEQSKFSFLSVIEYDINQSDGSNDLGFSQVLKLTSNQSVPENKVWKIVSGMEESNDFEIGDEYSGGIVYKLDGNGGGLIYYKPGELGYHGAAFVLAETFSFENGINYYVPSVNELREMYQLLPEIFVDGWYWVSDIHSNGSFDIKYNPVTNLSDVVNNSYNYDLNYLIIADF
jgi:hypothetical protein